MNAYIALSIGLLLGSLLGAYGMGVAMCWAMKQKEVIQMFLEEFHHEKWMPEICRIEGTINVALLESMNNIKSSQAFMMMALESVQKLKENITKTVKKYYKWS